MTHRARKLLLPALVCLAIAGNIATSHAKTEDGATTAAETDRAEERAQLFRTLKQAPNPLAAQRAAKQIWEFWTKGPDQTATDRIQEIFKARNRGNLDKALRIAETLTTDYPDYAEGWNQKATILFMKGKFDASLQAIERVLALEPKHFGALSGKAIILMRQGRMRLGQDALRKAVKIFPYLPERSLLVELPGEKI